MAKAIDWFMNQNAILYSDIRAFCDDLTKGESSDGWEVDLKSLEKCHTSFNKLRRLKQLG